MNTKTNTEKQAAVTATVVDIADVLRMAVTTGDIPFTNWLMYFTTWNCVLVLLHPLSGRLFDLRLSCWLVFVAATWVWYLSPGRAIVIGKDREHDYQLAPGVQTHLIDVLVHVIPLYAVHALRSVPAGSPLKALATAALLAAYLALAPTYRLYGESKDRLLTLGLAVSAMYVALVYM